MLDRVGEPDGPREIAVAMGLAPREFRRVGHQYTNDHWRVTAVDGAFFLRRSAPNRTRDAVDSEVTILKELAAGGWPVPRPLGEPMSAGARVWAAFEALPGGPRRPRSDRGWRDERRARGRLLGELHGAMADLPVRGQRPGFERAERSFDRLDDQLVGLVRTHPEEARLLGRHLDETRRTLDALDAAAQPAQLVHGDFSTWNLLFSRGQLSGVLDFDLSHLNHRVADFAISWRGVHNDIVRGYNEVNPLTPWDWQLLVPAFRAWYLWQAAEKLVGPVIPAPQLGFVLGHLNAQPTLAP